MAKFLEIWWVTYAKKLEFWQFCKVKKLWYFILRKGDFRMNNVILVGRLTQNPEIVEIDESKKVTSVILAVNRNFKNSDGIYETDFIRCILWNGVASTTTEYCHVGDVIGIKGRLQTSKYEDENKKLHYVTDVIAERVTFLSTNKKVEVTSDELAPAS